jgi:hypothetical protein
MKFVFTALLILVSWCPTEAQVRADKHKEYPKIRETFRKLVEYSGRAGSTNTIFVSAISKDGNREFAYAYWKEDNSIIVLHLPLPTGLEKFSSDYYWLTTKARIDLEQYVVESENDIAGSSFLVDRQWVSRIKRQCLNGVRLKI